MKAASTQPLVMESSPETTVTDNFNPLVPSNPVYGMGATGLIYEPLVEFDLAAPPKDYMWLASKFAWSNGGKSITFTIRSGVKWSDGTPFSVADVAFTFNLIKKYPAINIDGLKISSVSTSGNTVTVSFPSAQYANLQYIAGAAMLPEHIWSTVGDPATFVDAQPIGTGPYVLTTFTPEGITLKANPDYWQKSMEPAVQTVYFPVYSSNTSATTALFSGQIDWTGNYIPGLQKDFVDKSPAFHHFWEAAGSTNSYWMNLSEWPTNQLPVRQAISAALNRTVLAGEGEDGLENPVLNATGLTLPTFAAWSGPVKSLVNSATAQPAKAKSILEAAGYKLKGGYFYGPNGKEVTMDIVDPAAYTDYAACGALAAQELKAAGINATFEGLSVNAWSEDVAAGTFQMTEHWGNGGLTPYNLYDYWLDSTLVNGKTANGDYERVSDSALDKDLATAAGEPTVAAQTAALLPAMKYVAENLPVIPVTTASEWFEYDSDHFTGWPTQADPYETGQPSGTNNGPGTGSDLVVVLHLKPRA
jgi:peptide/nickel transport system substrate-binding protein